MDIIINFIKNTTVYDNFNYTKNIEKLIVDNIDYTIFINSFNGFNKNNIFIGKLNNNIDIKGYGILLLNQFILINGTFISSNEIRNSNVYINNVSRTQFFLSRNTVTNYMVN